MPQAVSWASGGSLVFVEEAAEDRPALDPFLGEIGHGVVGPGWAELEPAVRSSPVVVPGTLGHHDATAAVTNMRVFRRDKLGGLLREYAQVA